jgi:threonylcarbamoyladenosine tRNA methylthiotransferase MtaB
MKGRSRNLVRRVPFHYTLRMQVYLETLGCRLNFAETAALGRQLADAGYVLTASPDHADVCVLNSCAVTGEAARKSRQLARQMARANPRARLLLTGCYATLEGEMTAALPNVALVVGNARKAELLAIIDDLRALPEAEDSDRGGLPESGAPHARAHAPLASCATDALSRTRAFVKVQDGCNNRCAFCIVSIARGREQSQPIGAVVDEINALHAEGYLEAVLSGVHLGAYGRDHGTDLRSLLTALLADTAMPRLRLSSLEPFDVAPEFFDLWAQSGGRLMPHLHLPAQSGSDEILRRMRRRNRVADFERLARAARDRIPGLTITTDLIAGFPGETEDDFQETLDFARRVGFAHIHGFTYSTRAGTAAARFDRQVSGAERRRRGRLLADLDVELGRTARESFLTDRRTVLWEKALEPEDGLTRWMGLTDNYLRVVAESPIVAGLHNRISTVRLERLDGEDLYGEIIETHSVFDAGRSPAGAGLRMLPPSIGRNEQ